MQDQRFETLEARMPDINEPELMDLLGHDAEARMYLCLINCDKRVGGMRRLFLPF